MTHTWMVEPFSQEPKNVSKGYGHERTQLFDSNCPIRPYPASSLTAGAACGSFLNQMPNLCWVPKAWITLETFRGAPYHTGSKLEDSTLRLHLKCPTTTCLAPALLRQHESSSRSYQFQSCCLADTNRRYKAKCLELVAGSHSGII